MRSIVVRLRMLIVMPLFFSACAGAPTSASTVPSPPATTASAPTATTAPPSINSVPSTSAARGADGQIVFEDAGDNDGRSQIWIEDADGSNVRKLVSDDDTDSSPALSPDGRQVVFYKDSGDGFGRIMIVDVDGSDLHELDTGSRAMGCDAWVEGDGWSPDGSRLAFTRTCFVGGDFVKGDFAGQGLWTINVDGTGLREVTHNVPSKPCPPPDYCVHLEDHRAGWSPDGKQLVFERIDTSTDPERAAIFTIGIGGKHLRQVTPWTLDGNDPDWSPDGTLIVFNATAEPSPTQNIYTIHPDGTTLKQLTSGLPAFGDGGQSTFHPSWSPDGTQILFSHSPARADDGSDDWGFVDLFVMNRDGSELHVLAKTSLHENHAFWGPRP
jgi:Tol biopolymer transport system component